MPKNQNQLSAEEIEYLRRKLNQKPKWDLIELLLSHSSPEFQRETLAYFKEGGKA